MCSFKSPMSRTLQVIKDRENSPEIVLANEIARGAFVHAPPSAQALKLLYFLIDAAGGRIADEAEHTIDLLAIKAETGLRNHTRASLREMFVELTAARLSYVRPSTEPDIDGEEVIGSFIEEVRAAFKDDEIIRVRWWFGRSFRRIVGQSDYFAILDRQTTFALKSRYSLLLFQHMSSFVRMKHKTSVLFTVEELRDVLGVSGGTLDRFSTFNSRAIKPAISEINQLSRFQLEAKFHKVGRRVKQVEIFWDAKEDTKETKKELNRHSGGRKPRRDGTAERPALSFPTSGGLERSVPSEAHWYKLFETHVNRIQGGQLPASKRVCDDFRKMIGGDLDAPNIEKRFIGFCKAYRPS